MGEAKAATAQIKRPSFVKRIIGASEFSIFLALLALIVIMSFASPYFLTVSNIMNVLLQISRYAIISVGMALVMISGGIDLSVGYLTGFCACIFAWLSLHTGLVWPVILLLVLAGGALVGFVNGFLSAYVGLVPFIVTLATMKMLSGVNLFISKGMPITFKSSLSVIGAGHLGVVPYCVLIMIVLVFLGSMFAKYTEAGRGLYAIGNNERAAILSGINAKWLKCLSYVITGALCAVVGIVIAGNLGSADQTIGSGYEMDVIAAVVIGGVPMTGGDGKVWGSLIGASIMTLLRNAFILLGIPSYWQSIVIGLVIIGAMTIDIVRSRKRG